MEVLALRSGVIGFPKQLVASFCMDLCAPRLLSPEQCALPAETICKRLSRGTWVELSAEETRSSDFLSRNFITVDSRGKLRPVADLKFLSSYCDVRSKKCDSLEGNEALISKGDRMLSFGP